MKADGVVLKQSISAGEELEKGQSITLTVNKKQPKEQQDKNEENKEKNNNEERTDDSI